MTGVRWREDTGFEGKCDYCREWWPLDPDAWYPKSGMRRCRACWAEYKRQKEAGRRADEIVHAMVKARSRERYHMHRERRLAANRQWKAAHREHVRDYQRRWREANHEKVNEYARRYYAEARDVILFKKRAAYADGEAA